MLLPQRQDAIRSRISGGYLGLLLPLGFGPEEGISGFFAKGMAEVFEGAVGIAEACSGFFAGKAIEIEGPEGFIA